MANVSKGHVVLIVVLLAVFCGFFIPVLGYTGGIFAMFFAVVAADLIVWYVNAHRRPFSGVVREDSHRPVLEMVTAGPEPKWRGPGTRGILNVLADWAHLPKQSLPMLDQILDDGLWVASWVTTSTWAQERRQGRLVLRRAGSQLSCVFESRGRSLNVVSADFDSPREISTLRIDPRFMEIDTMLSCGPAILALLGKDLDLVHKAFMWSERP